MRFVEAISTSVVWAPNFGAHQTVRLKTFKLKGILFRLMLERFLASSPQSLCERCLVNNGLGLVSLEISVKFNK